MNLCGLSFNKTVLRCSERPFVRLKKKLHCKSEDNKTGSVIAHTHVCHRSMCNLISSKTVKLTKLLNETS